MADPFRQYFLESIQNVLEDTPTENSLLALFKFVSPSITLDEMLAMDSRERNKTLRILKTRIHPDKHPNDKSVTKIFQNVQNFYDECLENLSSSSSSPSYGSGNNKTSNRKRRKRPQSESVSTNETFPQNFSCFTQWPIVNATISTAAAVDGKNNAHGGNGRNCSETKHSQTSHPIPPTSALAKKVVPAYQAYKCIHARGTIAHGRPITKYYPWEEIQKASDADHSVYDIFDNFGGTKELETAESIKKELMSCGPVVSVSFRLLATYMKQLNAGEKAFAQDSIGHIHELLIVGWCLTPYGEAWQVQPLIDMAQNQTKNKQIDTDGNNSSLLHIGFGQFGIDDLVLAPVNNFENMPWQLGPSFDSDFRDAENWRDWNEMDLPLSETELKTLAKCFKKGMLSGESFVLRDEVKKAHSNSYNIKNIRWVDETEEWFVTVCQTNRVDGA